MTTSISRTAGACVAATTMLATAVTATAQGIPPSPKYWQAANWQDYYGQLPATSPDLEPYPGYNPSIPTRTQPPGYNQGNYSGQPAPPSNYNTQQQPYQGDYGPPSYQGYYGSQPPPQGAENAPPPGEYAPPPPAADGAYQPNAQQADQVYAQQYSAWAARYCVNERNNNVAAGAVIGGLLGSAFGAGVAGRGSRGTGAIVGGALGAGTGAAVGASRSSHACPPGYVVRADAPAFAYSGPPPYPGSYWGGPAWYRPWVWEGGRWVYYPYRSWYWGHRGYWRR